MHVCMSERASASNKRYVRLHWLDGEQEGVKERTYRYLLAQNTVDRIQNILIDMMLFS